MLLVLGLVLEIPESARLRKLAADANEASKQLESTNLVLRAKVLELEAKLRPRTITYNQRTNLVACLAGAPKKGRVNLLASILAPEAMSFAEEIANVLTTSGFEVHSPPKQFGGAMLAVGPPGAYIIVADVMAPNPRGAYLQSCFLSSGVELIAMSSPAANPDTNVIEIAIGQK